jgi:hypothetical protein
MLLNQYKYYCLALFSLYAINAFANPIAIETCEELQGIGTTTGPLSGDYRQTKNLDCSHMSDFAPIGDAKSPFTGSYDGQGFTINALVIQA